MIRIEKKFTHGYAKPVRRGVYLWSGDKEQTSGPRQSLDDLVYEALGEDPYISAGYHLERVTVSITIEGATSPAPA